MESVIAVDDLRVQYPGTPQPVVDGVSFEVAPGQVVGLLGPNGAGKSTIQRVLTGQLSGYQGYVQVLGRSVRRWGSQLYRRIGVGLETPAFFPKLSARENLALFASLHRGDIHTPEAALAMVGLSDVADHRPTTFSKGMQLRLNLARALLHRPDVLFLDEPTSGLDPHHADQVRDLVGTHARAGGTVFLTSHDMTTVEQICDTVAFIAAGRIRAMDTPRALRLAHGQPEVVVEHRVGDTLQQQRYPMTSPPDPGLLALLHRGGVETIHTREATLDEVFLAVTGAHR